jgi:hypothetical protein
MALDSHSAIAGSHILQQMCETRFESACISLGTLQSFTTFYSTTPSNGTVFDPHVWTIRTNMYVGMLLGWGSVHCTEKCMHLPIELAKTQLLKHMTTSYGTMTS